MILAIDVHYREDFAQAIGVVFTDWNATDALHKHKVHIKNVEEYVPGQFYKRELPCIAELLKVVDMEKIDTIVVDGYVFLNDDNKAGLGHYLYEFLEEKKTIIGVAKRSFHENEKNVVEVLRGTSQNPLYVTGIGVEKEIAAKNIRMMKGENRMPTLLKLVDTMTRE